MSAQGAAPGPIYNASMAQADDLHRSKESLKARSRLASRQGSRATRASRASIESRGPFSSNEDLDFHVELPPGILADKWDPSPPLSRPPEHPPEHKASRKANRILKRRQERTPEPNTEARIERKRGIRAKLRRILFRNDKTEANPTRPYGHRQPKEPQRQENAKNQARQSLDLAESEDPTPKEPSPRTSVNLPKDETSSEMKL